MKSETHVFNITKLRVRLIELFANQFYCRPEVYIAMDLYTAIVDNYDDLEKPDNGSRYCVMVGGRPFIGVPEFPDNHFFAFSTQMLLPCTMDVDKISELTSILMSGTRILQCVSGQAHLMLLIEGKPVMVKI